jgi:hypothetical protein
VAWFGLLLLATAAVWPAFAQQVDGTAPEDGSPIPFETEPQAEALPTFRGELDVSLINLFVTVIDSDGAPVAGLGNDDFEVFEDGKPVAVTNFEALGRRDLVPVEAAVDDVEETAVAPSEMPKGRYVALLFDTLADQVATYYYLGYRRGGPPDGKRHDIKVRVRGDGLHVRNHEQVLDRTEPQRLADLAVARLRLDVGGNDLGLEVTLEAPEPAEDERYVQPIQLAMPVDRLVLVPDGDRHIGQILVAVAVLDGDGNTAPAHLIRLRLAIPSDRYSNDAVAVQRIRLLMREGTQRIAVSVRDEVSGIEASQAIMIGGEVPGAGS